jgi:acyl carrier protein
VTDQELVSKVATTFGRVFGARARFREDLKRDDEPRWTSLRHVEFLVALESEFGLRFDGADATDMSSVGAVIDRIRQRLS